MKYWLKELRVTHYLKNCLIFLPAFFSGTIFDISLWRSLFLGFICFCLCASAIYLINDIIDIEKDKLHPTKCKRPIAAGKISIKSAIVVAVVFLLISYIILSVGLPSSVRINAIIVFSLYFTNNICYSLLGFKKIPLLDVALLVAGFYLRVLMGSALTGIEISAWLYLVIITGAFYLGFGKRRNELRSGKETRDVLKGYTENFLDKTMYSCMTMAIIFFALWCIQTSSSQWNLFSIPVMMLICYKYNMDIEHNENDGDPMNVILNDKILICLGILFVVIMFINLYF